MALLGMKSLLEELQSAIPQALSYYERGFREAWGSSWRERARREKMVGSVGEGDTRHAAFEFANGHVIMVEAILTAMAAYFSRGSSSKALALQEIRRSSRLGPKVARWVEENEEKLITHPALQRSRNNVAEASGNAIIVRNASAVQNSIPRTTGPSFPNNRQTGGGGVSKSADELYDAIRANNSDVKAISANTGIKVNNIQKVKDHVFYNEHLLDKYVEYGIPAQRGRFDSDLNQANAWIRLQNGNHTTADMTWMKHEVAERWYEIRHNSGYTEAHNAVERKWSGYPWRD